MRRPPPDPAVLDDPDLLDPHLHATHDLTPSGEDCAPPTRYAGTTASGASPATPTSCA
ncbi:hypothetical protein ACFQQB_49355 [Nonomuraea rubra]|uniref:hypothetical protein n=1 Tax=Nonomuraea rubra TaxID=46180 RepID=UPI00360A8C48